MTCRSLKSEQNPHVMVILETRVNEQRDETIILSLGFRNSFVVPTVGFSGGIWMLWDDTKVNVDILAFNHQVIHCVANLHEWLFSAVYASPNPLS